MSIRDDLLNNLTSLSNDPIPSQLLTLDQETLEYIQDRIQDAFFHQSDHEEDDWDEYWSPKEDKEREKEVSRWLREARKAELARGPKFLRHYDVRTGQAFVNTIIQHGWKEGDVAGVTFRPEGVLIIQSDSSEEELDAMQQTFISNYITLVRSPLYKDEAIINGNVTIRCFVSFASRKQLL